MNKFIILGLPKTGKTMLVHTMNRIDGFRVLGEIFVTRERSKKMPVHPQKIIEDMRHTDEINNLHTWYCKKYGVRKPDITKHVTYNDIVEFLDTIFITGKYCGFKLHHHHIESVPMLKDYIFNNPDIKLLHCNRRNKIKQALAVIGNRERGKRFRVTNIPSVVELIKDYDNRVNELRDWFGDSRRKEIFYEDLTGNTDINTIKFTSYIDEFLGTELPNTMEVWTRKNTRDKVSDNVINYDEFCKYFKGTEYEKWID